MSAWDCNPRNSSCHPDPTGPYLSAKDCLSKSSCTKVQGGGGWSCGYNNEFCVNDGSGPYKSLGDCMSNSACKNSGDMGFIPRWEGRSDCVYGKASPQYPSPYKTYCSCMMANQLGSFKSYDDCKNNSPPLWMGTGQAPNGVCYGTSTPETFRTTTDPNFCWNIHNRSSWKCNRDQSDCVPCESEFDDDPYGDCMNRRDYFKCACSHPLNHYST